MEPELIDQLLEFIRSRYFGKYRGTVVDNSDSTGRGRVQVRVPAVLGDLEVWAMPCVPYAGDGVGFYSLPASESGVWVEFEGGDPGYPIWVGCFWADNQLPDDSDAAIKIWKTESLTLRLDDTNDELLAEATSGSKITIAADVATESGGAAHTVGSSGVTSDSGGSGKVDVTSASVSVNSGAMEVR
jgi:uncharacterized protein involved in type VI secretion and phage assembly